MFIPFDPMISASFYISEFYLALDPKVNLSLNLTSKKTDIIHKF